MGVYWGPPLSGKLPACSGFRDPRVTACHSCGDRMEVLKVSVGDIYFSETPIRPRLQGFKISLVAFEFVVWGLSFGVP